MTKVTIKDEIMGSGKSTRMIEHINNSPLDKRWIIVTPFLAECHRYAGSMIDPDSKEKQKPKLDNEGNVIYTGKGCSASGRRFEHPISGYKNKVQHIEQLVYEGKDIVTTHTALKLFTPETAKVLKENNYTLVIDEELECVSKVNIRSERRRMLLDSGILTLEEDTQLLRWNHEDTPSDEPKEVDNTGLSWDENIKKMADNGSLVLVTDNAGNPNFFMWEYPIDFIKSFDEVFVLTYNVKNTVFESYLKFYNIDYTIEESTVDKSSLIDLITVVDNERMNTVGRDYYFLSAERQKKLTPRSAYASDIKLRLENYFKNSTYGKSTPEDRLWTCLLSARNVLKGKGYTKRYIPHNTKAVNDYRGTNQLAYVYNSFLNPDIYNYMHSRGEDFTPDGEQYALNELLQWVFRSRIREGNEITLYIPSVRMRDLLQEWLYKK